MPQILSKKNGGVYKPKSDEHFYICPTFKCAFNEKNEAIKENGQPKDNILSKDSYMCQQTPPFLNGKLPEDTRIGPPSESSRNILDIVTNVEKTEESTYKLSPLLAAKLQCNEWGLPNSSRLRRNGNNSYTQANKAGSTSGSGLVHPSLLKHGSLTPKKHYLKKRRNAIDLGRRARVLGNFLQGIEEEEEYDCCNNSYFRNTM